MVHLLELLFNLADKKKKKATDPCLSFPTLKITFLFPVLPEYPPTSPNNTRKGYFPTHKHAFSVHKSRTGFGKKNIRVTKANKVVSSATHMASKFNSNYVIFIYDSLDVVFM